VVDLDKIKSKKTTKQSKCYSNFHFAASSGRYGFDRKDAIKQIPKNLVYYEPTKLSRLNSWNKMVEYKYVISPFGNGLDCHRTWEALLLGCIPIVKKSELDTMYEGLPVLIVNEWSDVTQELLNTFVPTYKNIHKLHMPYWIYKFNKYKKNAREFLGGI
jgi:hypothetical protein